MRIVNTLLYLDVSGCHGEREKRTAFDPLKWWFMEAPFVRAIRQSVDFSARSATSSSLAT